MNDMVPRRSLMPAVVDDEGNSLEGPEMEKVSGLVMQMAQLAQLARINRNLERREITGHKVTTILQASSATLEFDTKLHWPYVPWARARFVNTGPDPVYVSINDDFDFTELVRYSELPIDFTEAKERICVIHYYCKAGQTASLQAVAFY